LGEYITITKKDKKAQTSKEVGLEVNTPRHKNVEKNHNLMTANTTKFRYIYLEMIVTNQNSIHK